MKPRFVFRLELSRFIDVLKKSNLPFLIIHLKDKVIFL